MRAVLVNFAPDCTVFEELTYVVFLPESQGKWTKLNKSLGPQIFTRIKEREILARLHAFVNLVFDLQEILVVGTWNVPFYGWILRTFRYFAPRQENKFTRKLSGSNPEISLGPLEYVSDVERTDHLIRL